MDSTANFRERLTVLESLVRAEALAVREVSRRAEWLRGEPPRDGRVVRTLVVDNGAVGCRGYFSAAQARGAGYSYQTLISLGCLSTTMFTTLSTS